MLINCSEQQGDCKDESKISMEKVLEQLKTTGVSEEGCNNYYANLE